MGRRRAISKPGRMRPGRRGIDRPGGPTDWGIATEFIS